MSTRRHGSSEKPRLRMDSYSGSGRSNVRSKISPPRRRELDNVMKKARREGPDKSGYWNKKLLEVEEKDPNRWRHSGFKELYGGGSKKSDSGSRSRSLTRSPRPKSPVSRPKSPPPIPRSPSPLRKNSKTSRKIEKSLRSKSPSRSRPRPKSPVLPRRPSSNIKPSGSRRPASPTSKRRSESVSSGSVSSCSDESCSVCSPKNKSYDRDRTKDKNRSRISPKSKPRLIESPRAAMRGRSRSFSVPRSKPSVVLEKPRRTKAKQRKREKEKPTLKSSRRRPIKVESDSDRSSSPSPEPRLTLSERFGKMAQWSCDRDTEHRNLRITAGDHMTVEMDSPPSPPYSGLSSFPEGAWDDVRVRYTYYKEQGCLRNLSLQDYIKWEQWWYKYQDWLSNERYYERYMSRRWM